MIHEMLGLCKCSKEAGYMHGRELKELGRWMNLSQAQAQGQKIVIVIPRVIVGVHGNKLNIDVKTTTISSASFPDSSTLIIKTLYRM